MTNFMKDGKTNFHGKWRLVKNDNFDQLLAANGLCDHYILLIVLFGYMSVNGRLCAAASRPVNGCVRLASFVVVYMNIEASIDKLY